MSVGPNEDVITFWDTSGLYSGYKKRILYFQRSHLQFIFNNSTFLVDITLIFWIQKNPEFWKCPLQVLSGIPIKSVKGLKSIGDTNKISKRVKINVSDVGMRTH